MSLLTKLRLGDVVELKKPHPCGSKEWEVTKLGNDIKARCLGCDRITMMRRSRFVRLIRRHIGAAEEHPGEC